MLETEANLRAQDDILRSVAAERFIAPIQREPFDYTSWQRTLWDDKSIEEISHMAMNACKNIPEPPIQF